MSRPQFCLGLGATGVCILHYPYTIGQRDDPPAWQYIRGSQPVASYGTVLLWTSCKTDQRCTLFLTNSITKISTTSWSMRQHYTTYAIHWQHAAIPETMQTSGADQHVCSCHQKVGMPASYDITLLMCWCTRACDSFEPTVRPCMVVAWLMQESWWQLHNPCQETCTWIHIPNHKIWNDCCFYPATLCRTIRHVWTWTRVCTNPTSNTLSEHKLMTNTSTARFENCTHEMIISRRYLSPSSCFDDSNTSPIWKPYLNHWYV